MTSYIKVQRICKLCRTEFTARTTATQYCSAICSKRAYKARKREEKITANNIELNKHKVKTGRSDEVKLEDREFLSVPQVAILLGCSRQNVYHLINTGQLKASNPMQRKTIIRRSNLNVLLNSSEIGKQQDYPNDYPITECYNMGEAQKKFGISGKALYDIVRRNNIPKFQQGKFVYVPKELLDKIFS